MLPMLAILIGATSAYNLTCHCFNGTECHKNGFCDEGCDVGWNGPGCQVGNLALGRAAYQSSTYVETDFGNFSNTAALAVDGLLDGSVPFPVRYCAHTDLLKSPGSAWWYVVLSTTHNYVLTKIVIFNRNNTIAARRLTNFLILYSNETEGDPNPNSSKWKECARESGSIEINRTYTCNSTAVAKRVAVYLTTDTTYNPTTILTLCEVKIFGYQQYACPNGFTGPGCLLRSCDQCASSGGQCTGDYGSCSYKVCPHRSLLPPDCWITLSDYSTASIRTQATCNGLKFIIELPNTRPNVEAPWVQLWKNSSDNDRSFLTIPRSMLPDNTIKYGISRIPSRTLYELSVRPEYCGGGFNESCYATSSTVFTAITGKRDYVFDHNNSCLFINVTSETPDCEPLSSIQVTCESDDVNSATIKSSNVTTCGLERGRAYTCSVTFIESGNIFEKRSAYIVTEPRSPSVSLVALSIGCSAALLVAVIAAITAFICYRQRKCSNTNTLEDPTDTITTSRARAGIRGGTTQPSSTRP